MGTDSHKRYRTADHQCAGLPGKELVPKPRLCCAKASVYNFALTASTDCMPLWVLNKQLLSGGKAAASCSLNGREMPSSGDQYVLTCDSTILEDKWAATKPCALLAVVNCKRRDRHVATWASGPEVLTVNTF